jgi:chaperonin GroEL (HSP60 family)
MWTIASNAGLEPGGIVCEARRRGLPWTFDVVRQEWVDAWSGGLVDPLEVSQTALSIAVSAASTVLSAEVLISRKRAPLALEP